MRIPVVECLDVDAVAPADQQRCAELSDMVWPVKLHRSSLPEYASAPTPLGSFPHSQRPRLFVVRLDGQIVAKAKILPREIATSAERLTVMALAGVLCHPQYRGRGLGQAIVRAAFGLVDDGSFPMSLFQTGVPGFYQKLGARVIRNRLFNSLAVHPGRSPFWEPCAMVYPAGYPLGDGEIDTLGPGW